MRCRAAFLTALAFALAACSQPDNGPPYTASILNRPIPDNAEGRDRECNFLGAELARQQNIAQAAANAELLPETALEFQAATRSNIAALESRAALVRCPAVTGTLPDSPASGGKESGR
jgi:hypothetical protein